MTALTVFAMALAAMTAANADPKGSDNRHELQATLAGCRATSLATLVLLVLNEIFR
jgi:hypothetical protein